jgi:hypothetical protein
MGLAIEEAPAPPGQMLANQPRSQPAIACLEGLQDASVLGHHLVGARSAARAVSVEPRLQDDRVQRSVGVRHHCIAGAVHNGLMKADIGLDESSVLTVTGPDLRHGGHPGEGVAHLRA